MVTHETLPRAMIAPPARTVIDRADVAGNPSHALEVDRVDRGQLAAIERHDAVSTAVVDIADGAALRALLAGKFAVLSAAPYHLTVAIAEAAAAAGVHYLDLTEDVESTRHVKRIAENAKTAFIPQCGLAPGFITIAA